MKYKRKKATVMNAVFSTLVFIYVFALPVSVLAQTEGTGATREELRNAYPTYTDEQITRLERLGHTPDPTRPATPPVQEDPPVRYVRPVEFKTLDDDWGKANKLLIDKQRENDINYDFNVDMNEAMWRDSGLTPQEWNALQNEGLPPSSYEHDDDIMINMTVGEGEFEYTTTNGINDPEERRKMDEARERTEAKKADEKDAANLKKARDDLNLIYPAGLPNTTDINIAGLTSELVSCVLSMVIVQYTQTLVKGLGVIFRTLHQSLDKVPDSSGTWHFGLANLITAFGSEASVVDNVKRMQEDGLSLFALIPVMPSMEDVGWCAKNMLYAYLSATALKWVNEGFNNAAIWIEDLGAELSNIYALSYRKAIGDVNLCIDLKASVELGLNLDFLKTQPVAPRGGCTIEISEEVGVNMMVTGGAYDASLFRKMYSNPNNNAMGAYLLTSSVANTNKEIYEKEFMAQANWFDGMWPFKDNQGKTVTPGSVIEKKMIDALSLETKHSSLASQWDQIIFMISNQILKKEINKMTNPLSTH